MISPIDRKLRSARQALVALSVWAAPGCAPVRTYPAAPAVAEAQAGKADVPNEPVIFAPGVISDAREQWRLTFTPDGNTAYFSSSDGFFPVSRQATIYVSHRERDTWTTPAVASFSGTYSDIDPFIAPNGQRLFFSSIRPVEGALRGDLDIWYADRTASGWGEPVRLGNAVNSVGDELYASASEDGTLYFASGPLSPQPGQHFDIYSADARGNAYLPRQRLSGAVNTTPVTGGGLQDAWEFNPEISVDGKTLVFTSLRPGGYGLGDLYISHRTNDEWTPARNLGPTVNTASDEYHPTLSRNKRNLYFVRRNPRRGDFYHIGVGNLLHR